MIILVRHGGLNDNEQNMVDIARDETFVETYIDESMKFMEKLGSFIIMVGIQHLNEENSST